MSAAADRRAAAEALAAKLIERFAKAGFARIDPPILQPADIYLDRSGEGLRGRLYILTDPAGAELCLRPDLTLPAMRQHLASADDPAAPARLAYHGPAFRFPRDGDGGHDGRPSEFHQAGIECLGLADHAQADADILALTVKAVCEAGLKNFDLALGDPGLFAAFVETLDLPPRWQARLKRLFWRPRALQAWLEQRADGTGAARGGLGAALGRLNDEDAEAVIADVLALADVEPVGGRDLADIAGRLLERAADTALVLPAATAKLVEDFLAVDGAPRDALARVAKLAKDNRLGLDAALDALTSRLDRIEKGGVDLSRARFATGFGRNLEIYTGFVFEITRPGSAARIAGGGRYDTLARQLGAARDIPAVGAAIWIERLLDAAGQDGKA
jgi:ATP phosphoribosyltransferase regulatory subunit